MKKRIIALILMSLLIIGLLPAGALAEEAAEAAYRRRALLRSKPPRRPTLPGTRTMSPR